jgi:hypothetical protein
MTATTRSASRCWWSNRSSTAALPTSRRACRRSGVGGAQRRNSDTSHGRIRGSTRRNLRRPPRWRRRLVSRPRRRDIGRPHRNHSPPAGPCETRQATWSGGRCRGSAGEAPPWHDSSRGSVATRPPLANGVRPVGKFSSVGRAVPIPAGITGVCTPRANLASLARMTHATKPFWLGYVGSDTPERIRTSAVPGPKPGALPLSYGGKVRMQGVEPTLSGV